MVSGFEVQSVRGKLICDKYYVVVDKKAVGFTYPARRKCLNMSNMSINVNLNADHAGKSTLLTTKINNDKNQRRSNILEKILCQVMGTD